MPAQPARRLRTAFTLIELLHAASRSNYVFADLHLQTVAATAGPWLGLWNPATWQP